MRAWVISLAKCCRRPLRGGFADLDLQIDKLRTLRDSYQASPQSDRYEQMSETKKSGERLCIP